MRVLIVSSDTETQKNNLAAVGSAFPGAEQKMFLDPLLAVKLNQECNAHLVVCDYALRIIDGIQLVKLLRRQDKEIIPILIDPGGSYHRDAYNLMIPCIEAPDAAAFRRIWEGETCPDTE